MDDDSLGRPRRRAGAPHGRSYTRKKSRLRAYTSLAVVALAAIGLTAAVDPADTAGAARLDLSALERVVQPLELLLILALLACSAFFSASETAFLSLQRLQLREMRNGGVLARLAAMLMEHPGGLLTTILISNAVVNILLTIQLAVPVDRFVAAVLQLPALVSYATSVVVCTFTLVFFGEILPKAMVLRYGKAFALFAAVPIFLTDRALLPLRNLMLAGTSLLFRITRFSEMPPAPFMTDEEFFSLLSESEASGVIERDERQMIQGILELSDVMVREILIPRPDIIALKAGSTVREALTVFREHEYSRIPVYEEDLDHIVGILYAKDLLSSAVQGNLEQPIDPLLRQIHFVPETMTVANFVKMTQTSRTHLAVVVDEFGGTEGIVTLQDALREVVGELGEEDDTPRVSIRELKPGVYRVEGSLPLDELELLTGHPVNDEEHTTVSGFIMDQLDKIPEEGDVLVHLGVKYTVEKVQRRRIAKLRVEVPVPAAMNEEVQ